MEYMWISGRVYFGKAKIDSLAGDRVIIMYEFEVNLDPNGNAIFPGSIADNSTIDGSS